MKTYQKFLGKLTVFFAALCALFFVTGKEARAASEWVRIPMGVVIGDNGPVRAGDYYFWCDRKQTKSGDRSTVYRSTEEYGDGKKIYSFKDGLQMEIYTNGEKLFMMENVSKKGRWYAWAAMKNADGSGKVKVLMDKRGRSFVGQAICGDTLYFSYTKSSVKNVYNIYKTEYVTYAMKIGKKTIKKVLKGYSPVEAHGNYVIVNNEKGNRAFSVFDTKTRKVRKLASQVSDETFFMTDKYIYYATNKEPKKDKYTYVFYRKKLNGSGKAKKLGQLKSKGSLSFRDINNESVIYWKPWQRYEYNFKTGKTRKVKA